MKYRVLTYILIAVFTVASCGRKAQKEAVAEEQPTGLIVISQEQFKTAGMEMGKPEKRIFDDVVRCNGNILVQPSGVARISSPVTGLVKRINCISGEKVSRGKILFELSGNEFIELQKDFAETSSMLRRTRTEYERINALFGEKVGSEKDLIMAETEFKVTNARYSALKMKISLLGLEPAKIEEGNFYESFFIRTPINGYVSKINVTLGEYADQQTTLTEVLDLSALQLIISVFEKDISRIRTGQKIMFNVSGNPSVIYRATVKSIGKYVDNETKTISCIANIDNISESDFVNNTYVEARINTAADTVYAVPEESVLKSGNDQYILAIVKNENGNYYLSRVRVETGRTLNGYTELIDNPATSSILIKGAYNIRLE
jgi:membrane fusion protein, heavy metal efflux system